MDRCLHSRAYLASILCKNISTTTMGTAFDYVIVGGGTAGVELLQCCFSAKRKLIRIVGCVLASRLSSYLPHSSILVIEAGLDQDPRVKPSLGLVGQPAREIKWVFPSAPQKALGDKTTDFTQGKILGGTSSINHQVWSRGAFGDLYVFFVQPPSLPCLLASCTHTDGSGW